MSRQDPAPAEILPLDTLGDEYIAWQRSRLSGLGGSDIAAVMGLSKWASPYSVWVEKTTGTIEEPSDADRERFDAGHDAEVYLELQFRRHHPDLHVGWHQVRLERPGVDWAFAHPDGIALDGNGVPVGIWEAKTANDYTPWDEVPAYYQCQLQWAIWLNDLPRAYLTCGFAGWKTVTYIVERDEDDIALVVETGRAFWHDNVLANVPPPIDAHPATADAIAARYPRHVDDVEAELDPADIARWLTLRADETAVKAEMTDVKNRIAAALGEAAIGTVDGDKAVTYRAQTRKTACTECGHTTESKPFRVLRAANQKGE